jgi:serine O-acetyltransferase
MSAFGEDLKRWLDRGRRPQGAEPSSEHLRLRDAIGLFWRNPAVWATGIYRLSNWCKRRGIRGLPLFLQHLNLLLFGIEIGCGVPIGPGLYIAHPFGSVIIAQRIGANASFIHAVTVGMRSTWEFPVIGDGVFVGAGARILGGIRLGNDCTIGANAVVIDDVPAGATAVGVPAHIIHAETRQSKVRYAGGGPR